MQNNNLLMYFVLSTFKILAFVYCSIILLFPKNKHLMTQALHGVSYYFPVMKPFFERNRYALLNV